MSIELPRVAEEATRLLELARAGDQEALGRLMELFRGYLLSVASGELAGPVRAKVAPSDVVQDAFLEGYRLFARFNGGADEFRAWLRSILRHKVADLHDRYLAAQKRQADREVSLDQGGSGAPLREGLPGPSAAPGEQAAIDEEVAALFVALDRLPEECRQVIVWRQWDGLGYAEIGRRLGCSEEAARKCYARSLQRLSAELEGEHGRRAAGRD